MTRTRLTGCLIFFLLAVRLAATLWYVDSAATGSANGTSRANAWTTFAAINQSGLTAGDIVYVYNSGSVYNARFTISKSGSSTSSRINYVGIKDGSGNRPVLRGVNAATFSYIGFYSFEITHTGSGNNYPGFAFTSGDGWQIEDCYIHDTYVDGILGAQGSDSSNHTIRGNTLAYIAWLSLGSDTVSSNRSVSFNGGSNLVEYNTFGYGLDRMKLFGTKNIMRNNYDSGTGNAETTYTATSPYPFHIDEIQIDRDGAVLSEQVLVEKNWVDAIESTTGNGHFIIAQDDGSGSGQFNWFITRFNVATNIGEAFSIMQEVNDTYFLNNSIITIYNLNYPTHDQPVVTWNTPAGATSLWLNNGFALSPDTVDTPNLIDTQDRPSSFTADYQGRYQMGATGSLPTATHNIGGSTAPSTDPSFVNSASANYRLQNGSAWQATGGPVTTANGSGSSSTTLIVNNSHAIFDGWGVTGADADYIKVGSNSYQQVVSINYSTHTITLSSPITWSSGNAIYVKGMEDVGGQPYGIADPSFVSGSVSAATGSVTATVTVADSNNVRFVEFLEDNFPIGTDYVASSNVYTTSWTRQTGSSITYRIYNYWASRTPIVSGTLSVAGGAAGSVVGGKVTFGGKVTVN